MSRSGFANTPEPPYYAAIFTTQRTEGDQGYGAMGKRMMELAAQQPGFLGAESVRGGDGLGITVSYWTDLDAIAAWKAHGDHRVAQEHGNRLWYEHYELRIAKVEQARSKPRSLD